jgi:putative transposase
VRKLAADGIHLALSCRVLKLSRQPYYRWLATPVPEADVVEAYRANALFDAHADAPEFGYRYLADEAEAAGEPMAVRTAWRLCSANAWFSDFGKARVKNGKRPGPAVHDDLCAVVDADGREPVMSSELMARISSGSQTSPSTTPMRASCTCAQSRTPARRRWLLDQLAMKARLAVDALTEYLKLWGPVDCAFGSH